jgi:predicted dehydrogenase
MGKRVKKKKEENKKMTIRIGLIGCGIVTQKAHIPAIIRDQRFQITALCRRDTEKLKPLQRMFPSAKIYTDFNELLRSGEVDCVLVASDVDIHLATAQSAIDNNVFALIEKPVDSSSENIKNFIDKNSESLNKIMVGFNRRFIYGTAKLNQLKESKQLSNIIGGTISSITKQGRKKGWKGILQNLIHACDTCCHTFGNASKVSANFSSTLNDEERGKTIAASILTEKGCAVNLFFTSSSSWKLPIHEKLELFDDKQNSFQCDDVDKVLFSKTGEDGDMTTTYFKESNSIFFRYESLGFIEQINKFGDLVEGKTSNPSPNMHEALAAQELFEKIFEFDK